MSARLPPGQAASAGPARPAGPGGSLIGLVPAHACSGWPSGPAPLRQDLLPPTGRAGQLGGPISMTETDETYRPHATMPGPVRARQTAIAEEEQTP